AEVNYREAVSYLSDLGKFAPTPGMMRMLPLLERLDNPHRNFRVIHVAGTNGKGSTCAFIDSILRSAGVSTLLFTSPHLQTVRERMRINGEMISEDEFARLITRIAPLCLEVEEVTGEHPTFFEILTAAMYRWGQDREVEWVVQEVGLGGRYDATNVVADPMATVITDVDLDHTEILGSTLGEIAREKAGIVKPGVPLVMGPLEPEARRVVQEVAREKGVPAYSVTVGDGEVPRPSYHPGDISRGGASFSYLGIARDLPAVRIEMLGGHQMRNAALALATMELIDDILGLEDELLLAGMRGARWPGRVEVVSTHPLVIMDGAHNPSGARVLAVSLRELFPDRRIHAVIGIMGNKDFRSMLGEMSDCIDGRVVTTRAPVPRATPEDELAEAADTILTFASGVSALRDPDEALEAVLAKAHVDDVIVVWGSLYLVGALRSRWQKRASER
ncbi:MAG: bifunctional folylpolyglutamate synthase/dihydrofolate synthase, partial [Clostridia bacterium]